MGGATRLSLGGRKGSIKDKASHAPSEEKTVHLALSPTPSERARKDELDTINALIKKSSEGDLGALRERRESFEKDKKTVEKVENPYAPHTQAEILEINDLVANPAKVRERRVTKDRERKASKDQKHDAPNDASAAPAPQAAYPVSEQPAAEGSKRQNARRLWQDAKVAVQVHAALGTTPDDAEGERLPSPNDILSPAEKLRASTEHLRGAAARGAKAAALGRVKEAASTVGGVFLTSEQWDAMRAEVAQLKVTNKRLEEQLYETRSQLQAKEDELATTSNTATLLQGAGSFIAKAWAAASPMAMRPSSTGVPGGKSPFSSRLSGRGPIVVDVADSKAGVRPPTSGGSSLW